MYKLDSNVSNKKLIFNLTIDSLKLHYLNGTFAKRRRISRQFIPSVMGKRHGV